MPESRWRVDVVPVRVGARAEGVPYRGPTFQRFASGGDEPAPELIAIRRGTLRDGAIAVLVFVALTVAVLKPWGATTREQSVARPPAQPVTAQAPARPEVPATPRVIGPVVLPAAAFDPAPASCMVDVGWRICVLSASGGQALRNVFDPDASPLQQSPASPVPLDPAVVLVTTAGAAFGFYPPDGTAADGTGAIEVSAWQVDQALPGTRSVDLKTMGPLRQAAGSAANVFVPPADALVSAGAWPDGGYVFWLKGSGASPWEQYFAVEVVTAAERLGGPWSETDGGLGAESDGVLRIRSLLPGKVAV
jgi:hypothetical protein